MNPVRLPRLALLTWVLLVSGCGSSSAGAEQDFRASPLLVMPSASGALSLAVWTAPDQPPTRGAVSAKMRFTDPGSGAPIDGLNLTVVPWMPSMGHGSTVQPGVSPIGDGTYIVANLELFMPGYWELRTTTTGTVNDSAIVALDVS